MMLRLGVLGFSEGNGHPFSFSAIINGFDQDAFELTGWDVIHAYLRARRADEFGVEGVRVTTCWMPNPAMAKALAAACRIDAIASEPRDMIGKVDAVMILRDDAESHWDLAAEFLKAGMPVFVDKPLCTDHASLERFSPFLRSGQLMSCSGLRYAGETDEWRADAGRFGAIRLIRGAVVNDWAGYGVHILEAAMGALPGVRPAAVRRHPAAYDSLSVRLADGSSFQIDAIGRTAPIFTLDVFGDRAYASVKIRDNFTAFRRTISAFVDQARSGRPSIAPDETILIIRTLIAGLEAQPGGAEVEVG